MILYRRTTRKLADIIVSEGFKDATGTYLTDREWSGVWVSDVPLDSNDGVTGDVLFEINTDFDEATIADYEWIEEGKGCREWLIPAIVLSGHVTLREVSEDE